MSNKRAIPEVSLGKGLASANGTIKDASGEMKGKRVKIARAMTPGNLNGLLIGSTDGNENKILRSFEFIS